jgi:hypothetical protein
VVSDKTRSSSAAPLHDGIRTFAVDSKSNEAWVLAEESRRPAPEPYIGAARDRRDNYELASKGERGQLLAYARARFGVHG